MSSGRVGQVTLELVEAGAPHLAVGLEPGVEPGPLEGSLLNADWKEFGELMNIHQGLLESLGVGTAQLARLVYAARKCGAFGAKLSGAGGGDCMVALAEPGRMDAVRQGLTIAGAEIVRLKPNAEGLRLE